MSRSNEAAIEKLRDEFDVFRSSIYYAFESGSSRLIVETQGSESSGWTTTIKILSEAYADCSIVILWVGYYRPNFKAIKRVQSCTVKIGCFELPRDVDGFDLLVDICEIEG